jgi:hypothetical protein
MGCDSPAGLFLDPGQTSGEFFYNCKYEALYSSSGSCGSPSAHSSMRGARSGT